MQPQSSRPRAVLSRLNLFVAGGILASILTAPIVAQNLPAPGATVTIHVQDEMGGPISIQAMVHLTGVDTLTNLVQPTREGVATFTGVQGSEFSVEVTAPGFDTIHEDIVIAGRTGSNDNFIELRRRSENANGKSERVPAPLLTGKTRTEIDAAIEALRADKPDDAAPHIAFALEHAPGDPNVQYYAGVYSQKIKNLPDARAHFETAINIFPEHFGAQLDLGSLLLQLQNDARGAIPHFEKALSLQPESWLAHWLAAEAYLRLHDPANAKLHAAKAIDIGKDKSAGAAVTLARAQLMAGDREAGRKTLEKFVRRYPQDANVPRAQALLNSPAFSPGSAATGHPNS